MSAPATTFTESNGMTFDPVSVQPNIDPAYFELERERIFKRSWLNICRVEDLAAPGSYVVRDLEVLQASVLLTRDNDGTLRAFHNVCMHRGNKLVMSGGRQGGNAQGFRCSFHGWTYGLDGKLSSVLDEGSFRNLDHCKLGLKPIAVDVWRGFVFICMANPAPVTLEAFLGDWGRVVGEYPFDGYRPIFNWSVTLDCNWKVFVDAFQETYHANALHRKSGYKPVASRDNPFVHLLDVQLFPDTGHRRISLPANLEFQPEPSTLIAVQHFPHEIFAYSAESKSASKEPLRGANRLQAKNWSFDINICFPNMEFLLGEGWYLYYNYWPISVDRTRFNIQYCPPPPKNAAEHVSLENQVANLRDVILEDLSTLEDIQHSLKSGAIKEMQFSDMEVLCRFHYQYVNKLISGAGA